jgi:periplasmic protein TonB
VTLRALAVCGGLSLLAHLSALAALDQPEAAMIPGGAPSVEARLGNSFQDIASGSATPVPAPDPTLPVGPDAMTPSPATDMASATMSVARPPAADMPPDLASKAPPAAPIAPATAEALPPVAPDSRLTGIEPVAEATPALPDAVRPRPRPDPAPKAAAKPESAAGAATEERRGTAEGAETGTADTAATAKAPAQAAGNAEAANYPGLVMKQISRTRKPRVGARGTAILGFEIGTDGSLGAVRVLRSSGEAAVDAAAVDHLRRAAPFPPPPTGADRRFQIEYVSKG